MPSKESVLAVIDQLIVFLTGLAALTPIKFDDTAVAVLVAIRNSDKLIDWLLGRLVGSAGIPDGVFSVESLPDDVAEEFRNRGVERPALGKFLELIMPILIRLLDKWLAAGGT